MELKIANTPKFLMSRTIIFFMAFLWILATVAFMDTRGGKGWYYRVNPDFYDKWGFLIWLFFLVLMCVCAILLNNRKTIGLITLTDDNIIIKKEKVGFMFDYAGHGKNLPPFKEIIKSSRAEKLSCSEIFSIELFLDSSKEKPVLAREYFNGAENNWFNIMMYNGKKYKTEVFIKTLDDEKNLIVYLDSLKKKAIRISYGTKGKTILHAIRCVF